MKITLEENSSDGFLTLPKDVLVQVEVVADPEVRDVPGRDGKEGWQKLNFRFKIIELPTALEEEFGALVGGTIFGDVGARFTEHPDNKLRQWAEALLDIGELTGGFELDTEMLVGRRARALIGHYTKKNSTDAHHKVVGLLPLAPAASQAAQPSFAGFGSDEPPF